MENSILIALEKRIEEIECNISDLSRGLSYCAKEIRKLKGFSDDDCNCGENKQEEIK